MSEGIVTSLECGTPHPDYGWPCHRLRRHGGEHMAAEPDPLDGRPRERFTWRDFRDCCTTYPGTEHMPACALSEAWQAHPAHDDGPETADDTAGVALEGLGIEPTRLELVTDVHDERIRRAYAALLTLGTLVAGLCAPAVVIAVWRWAL